MTAHNTVLKQLSPNRKTVGASDIDSLVANQLVHFGITDDNPLADAVATTAKQIYQCYGNVDTLWEHTLKSISSLQHKDKIALFNAKKFLSFQLAKVLDSLQNPFRRNYQELGLCASTLSSKGPYPVFDNVTAIFSAAPNIVRSATYIYACTDWIADAFEGRELIHEIYSRLMNPTSISLANHIIDLEAGPYADQYLAWNFNSGMAATDGLLSHLLGYRDVVIRSSNIYGGTHQLLHDWYAKRHNLDVAIVEMQGETADDFNHTWNMVQETYANRLNQHEDHGLGAFLFIESPCNPHGNVLDVPAICKAAHKAGVRVILDATVATPFLQRTLLRDAEDERPDFIIHSYTKDLSGTGGAIGGVVIGRNEDMFIPKGDDGWEQTLFWNTYYVKGAFLPADAAFEIIQGIRTLPQRMMAKCINTEILARFLDSHPDIKVNCPVLPHSPNRDIAQKSLAMGLPAPLFTIELHGVPIDVFKCFFDNLEPTFSHMISLGQTNTIISCPALTTHSELQADDLKAANIHPTTIRIAMGIENPFDLIKHFIHTSRLTIDPAVPGFSDKFMREGAIKTLVVETYTAAHQRYAEQMMIKNGVPMDGFNGE